MAAMAPALATAQATNYEANPHLKCLAVSLAAKSMYEQITEMQMGDATADALAQNESVGDRAREKFHSQVVKGDESVEKAASKALLAVAKKERAAAGAVLSAAVKKYSGGMEELKTTNFAQTQSAEYFARRFKQLKCI